jgi:uncharacterized protein (TIGR02145 family)
MKKTFFFLAMLISVATSATVTVTPISTDYNAKQVTFKVGWTNTPSAPHNNRVWIWIDFCPVTGTQPATTFSPATITNPTKVSGNGTITGLNGRGFFIEYAATNAGTTVTATLNNAPAGKFNWCAYSSDYPPNVTLDKGTYTFKGTTNFVVSSHAQPITSNTVTRTSLTVNSQSTFTDATGYPGIGSLYCPYTGSDLYMDASHLCQQRTSGAKNWEAWIKDSRDNELYRIVYMPDNVWWLAQNVKYAGAGSANTSTGCTPDNCGRNYTGAQMSATYTGSTGAGGYGENKQGICPNNWKLPIMKNFRALVDAISPTNFSTFINTWDTPNATWLLGSNATVVRRLVAKNNHVQAGNDYYGFANKVDTSDEVPGYSHEGWRGNQMQGHDVAIVLAHRACHSDEVDAFSLTDGTYTDRKAPVRCFRQL